MLEIFASDNCPTCKDQMDLLDSLQIDYTVIKVGSPEYDNHELKEYIGIVPFIAARAEAGHLTYAKQGFHDEKGIKTAIRSTAPPFNLKKARSEKL